MQSANKQYTIVANKQIVEAMPNTIPHLKLVGFSPIIFAVINGDIIPGKNIY